MFDLFRRRDTVLRYLLMFLLGLVAVSMVWYLIPGSMTGTSTRGESTLAEIGGESVSIQEVSMRVEQMLRNSGMQRQNAYPFVNNMVDSLVQGRAVEYQARRMGFQVTDAEVADAIKRTVPQLFPNGQFVGHDAYVAFMRQNGLTVADYEMQVRRQLLTTKLIGMVDEGIVISPADIEAEYRKSQDKIKIEFIAIRQTDIGKQVTVSDAEVAAEYEKRKATLKIPERRVASVYFVDEAMTTSRLQASDADLRRAYDEQRDRFRTPERLQVRHILLKTTDKPAAEVAKIQAKTEDLLKQLKAGASFEDLAKKNSEDPTSAVKGGDLGWIVKGQTVKNFEEAAWALQPKQLSNVVKTEYGFHILQLMAREDARIRPFEEVRAELLAETQKQVVYDRMQKNIDALRAAVVKEPSQGIRLIEQFNAQLEKTGAIGPQDTAFGAFGPSPELAAQLNTLKKGEATSVVQGQGSRLGFAVVEAVEPERSARLEDVAARLRDEIAASKTGALAKSKVAEALARAKAPGADFKKIAAEMKLEYKTTPEFNRSGAAEGLGQGTMLSDSFGRPVGYVGNALGVGDAQFITRVTESIPADMTKLATERENIVNQIRQGRVRERVEIFSEALVQRLTKEGKIKVYPDALKRLLGQYTAS